MARVRGWGYLATDDNNERNRTHPMMPEGDTLFVAGFNALAKQCGHDVRIPEGSATMMESVDISRGMGDALLTIKVHVIVPHTVRRGYDVESDAEEVVNELPEATE
jgi:hypothetical protein